MLRTKNDLLLGSQHNVSLFKVFCIELYFFVHSHSNSSLHSESISRQLFSNESNSDQLTNNDKKLTPKSTQSSSPSL